MSWTIHHSILNNIQRVLVLYVLGLQTNCCRTYNTGDLNIQLKEYRSYKSSHRAQWGKNTKSCSFCECYCCCARQNHVGIVLFSRVKRSRLEKSTNYFVTANFRISCRGFARCGWHGNQSCLAMMAPVSLLPGLG